MAFDFKAYDSLTGALGIQLFSALPGTSSASGLKAAAAAAAKMQRKRNAASVDTSGLAVTGHIAQRTADNYRRLSTKLNQTVSAATDARDTLLELKTILSDMRRLIVLSQSASVTDDERRQNANEFDRLLGKLNSKVSSSGGVYGDLIGSPIRDIFSGGEITYQTRPDSQVTQSVTGVYSGSDYTITDGIGDVYFTDIYGSTVTKFPFAEGDNGTTIATTDTISYDSTTGAISLTHNGDVTPYLSGTLERKGLGLLHSFLYGDFTDPAKLDVALSDLDAASGKLRFNIALMEGQLAKVTAHRDYNAKFIEENQKTAIRITAQKSAEEQRNALEAQRQNLLYAKAYQGTVSFDGSGSLLSLGLQNLYDIKA